MPRVTVKRVVPQGGVLKVMIDGSALTFANNTAARNLAAGDHPLQWFVKGVPGTKFAVEITEPGTAVWSEEAKLDSSGKDAGLHWIVM